MRSKLVGGLVVLTLMLPGLSAQAAGLWLYEMGTPDVGTARARMASRASDAATAFANPAGMTRLTESQLRVGVQPLYADIKCDTQKSSFGGGDGGNAGGLVPTGSLSYINNTTDSLKFGLTAGSYLGLGIKFDDDWTVSAGFAYDSSQVRNANRSIVLPLDRQYRYGLGLTTTGARTSPSAPPTSKWTPAARRSTRPVET